MLLAPSSSASFLQLSSSEPEPTTWKTNRSSLLSIAAAHTIVSTDCAAPTFPAKVRFILPNLYPSGAAAEWERVTGRKKPGTNALYDPAVNLEIGCWYLARGMRKYAAYTNVHELALARYNAGESRSEKWKPERKDGDVIGRITIPSTKEYVAKIMSRYRAYREAEKSRGR